jgi:hypothetical protein
MKSTNSAGGAEPAPPLREMSMFDADTYALLVRQDLERQFEAPSFKHRMAVALGMKKMVSEQTPPVRLSKAEAAQINGRYGITF